MAGIRIMGRDDKAVLHQAVWVDPDEVPVIFIMVKDGATALAHPDYIADLLYQMDSGDLEPRLAWDFLMIKAPSMPHPELCQIRRLTNTGGAAEFIIGSRIVYRIT